MRAVTKKKSIALFAIGLVSLAIAAPSSATAAGATQADVDYSTQVSALAKEFAKVTVAWDAAISKPPILAFGSKWSKYKTAATKSSKVVLATVAKMDALVPSEGFPKSGPMLKKACAAYKTAITALNKGIQKNNAKAITKATPKATKASKAYLAWSEAYAAEVAALNG
jgi:hypothetical protein